MDQDATWYGSRPRPTRGLHDIVLYADPAAPRLNGHTHPPRSFRPMSVVVKRLDGLRCHLVWGQALAQATLCSMRTQVPPEKGHTTPTQFLVHVYCGQMAGWMKTPLGTEVDLGPGTLYWTGSQLSTKGAQQPLPRRLFGPCLLWHVAHVHCLVLVRHVDDRPHRVSAGRGDAV